MRISDWSSDVCSSDLAFDATRHRVRLLERRRGIDQRHATADQCTECRQQVVDIEAAEQAAADRRATQMTVDDKRNALRSEERRVGKGCVMSCRSRLLPYN